MELCKYCGEKIAGKTTYCKFCGKQLKEDKIVDKTDHIDDKQNNDSSEEQKVSELEELSTNRNKIDDSKSTLESINNKLKHKQSENKNERKLGANRMKKQRQLVFTGISIIVLLITSYIVLNNIYSPTRLVKKFENAVEKQDTKALSSILTTESDAVKLDEDEINAFIKLCNSKSSEFKNMMISLRKQANGANSSYGSFPIELEKAGKQLLIFDDYNLKVLPIYINVSTTYKDTDILVNGKKLITVDEDYFNGEVGPIAPGIHEVKAVYDTGFFYLDKEVDVEAFNPTQSEVVDLHLKGEEVSFDLMSFGYDQLSSVKLYINGKETGYDLIDKDTVGPLLTDGSMKASFEAEFPWGKMKTDEVLIDDSDITFNLGDSESFRQELEELIITFNEEFIENYTSNKPSGFTTASASLEDMILEEANMNKEASIIYRGAFHGIDFYLDSFELKQSYDNLWEVKIDTITYYEQDMYSEGEKADLQQSEDEIRYEIAFDPEEKEWIVVDLGYSGSMDKDRMDRYKIDEPTTYTSEWEKNKK